MLRLLKAELERNESLEASIKHLNDSIKYSYSLEIAAEMIVSKGCDECIFKINNYNICSKEAKRQECVKNITSHLRLRGQERRTYEKLKQNGGH